MEYSVDVLIGLQLFVKERQEAEKRQAIDEAKRKNPREVELVILKNRIYKTGQSVFFKYYPAYDYFTDENCGELYEAKREMDNDKNYQECEGKEKNEEYSVKIDKDDPNLLKELE